MIQIWNSDKTELGPKTYFLYQICVLDYMVAMNLTFVIEIIKRFTKQK